MTQESGTINLIGESSLYPGGLQYIGFKILKDALREAFMVMSHATTSGRRGYQLYQSYVFVQGSGLEHVIQNFGIDVDADDLRETFYDYCKYKAKHYNLSPHGAGTHSALSG